MAKLKGKGVVLAGLAAGAASFLRKKENRDKVMDYVNQAKEKVTQSGGVQGMVEKVQNKIKQKSENTSNTAEDIKTDIEETIENIKTDVEEKFEEAKTGVEETIEHVANTAGTSSLSEIDGHQMVDEGGVQEAIDTFNNLQEESKE